MTAPPEGSGQRLKLGLGRAHVGEFQRVRIADRRHGAQRETVSDPLVLALCWHRGSWRRYSWWIRPNRE
jgi:hypothetical protein